MDVRPRRARAGFGAGLWRYDHQFAPVELGVTYHMRQNFSDYKVEISIKIMNFLLRLFLIVFLKIIDFIVIFF